MHKSTLPVVASLFLAACGQREPSDPYAPPAHYEVDPPDWTQAISIEKVSPFSCRIRNAQDEIYDINPTGTFIDEGLSASRSYNSCAVRDNTGVQCEWNSKEELVACRVENPQFNAYMSAKNNIHF
jgi:hypothetical protein